MRETVAVIIPAFNAEPFIAEAIESVLAQTASASQLIVVDDGSTDSTAASAEKFGDALMLLRRGNGGVSAARNEGAKQTTCDWLLFLDADDRLLPAAIENMLARAECAEFGVVYGQTKFFDDTTRESRLHGLSESEGPPPAAARASFWKAAIATPGAALIRADFFNEIGGFDPVVNTLADRDFWIRAGALREFGFIPKPVIEKREHSANMSGDLSRARIQAVQVQFSFLDWCSARGISIDFLQTSPGEIIERNLQRALETRSFAAAEWICAEAARREMDSPIVSRARRILAMPAFAREAELKVRELLNR